MTREEAKGAAESYASKMCDLCLDEYCKEMRLVCPQFKEYTIAFREGIKWADEHPKNMWHSANEFPTKDALILYRTTIDRYDVVFQSGNEESEWNAFVEDNEIAEWIYIDELHRIKIEKKQNED